MNVGKYTVRPMDVMGVLWLFDFQGNVPEILLKAGQEKPLGENESSLMNGKRRNETEG